MSWLSNALGDGEAPDVVDCVGETLPLAEWVNSNIQDAFRKPITGEEIQRVRFFFSPVLEVQSRITVYPTALYTPKSNPVHLLLNGFLQYLLSMCNQVLQEKPLFFCLLVKCFI